MSLEQSYLDDIKIQLNYYKKLAERAIAQLQDDDLFWRHNQESNSIAIIIKHLHGNMLSRWTDFLKSDGEKEWRDRDGEFEIEKEELENVMDKWEEGWHCLFHALDEISPGQLTQTAYIRNMGQPVIQLINRQMAHYAYHIGQIVQIAKERCGNNWQSLTITKGASSTYNSEKFKQQKRSEHFTQKINPQ